MEDTGLDNRSIKIEFDGIKFESTYDKDTTMLFLESFFSHMDRRSSIASICEAKDIEPESRLNLLSQYSPQYQYGEMYGGFVAH